MQNAGGEVCFGRRGTPRGGHTRRGNNSQPNEQRLKTRYTRLDGRGLTRALVHDALGPPAGSPQSRVHEGWSSQEWRSLHGPGPGACAGRARAQTGKTARLLPCSLYALLPLG